MKKSVLPRPLPLVLALLGAWSLSSAAPAQTTQTSQTNQTSDTAIAAQSEDAAALPTITVSDDKGSAFAPATAQVGPYRGASLHDVPATVNVISRELLDAQGAIGLHDALRNVAGVVRQQQSGIAYDQISIRGINLDNRASYMFNGVLPFDNNLPIPMEDKERMEVLKGAAALYYGFITPGGIVNMVTKRAGSTPVTALKLSTDNNGSTTAHVDIGRRFGENQQFGLRINAVTNNVHTPVDNDNGYRRMFSAAFDWKVNNQLTLKYDAEFIKAKVTEQAAVVPQAAVNGVITLPSIPDPSKLLSMSDKATISDAQTHLLQAEYAFNDNWSGRLSLGQSKTHRDRWLWIFDNYNVNTGAGTVYGADQVGQIYTNQNVRAEVNGLFSTGFIKHDLLVGASQNRLYQPSFYTYMYRASQNLYNPIEVSTLIRSPTGTKSTLRDRGFNEQTIRDTGVYAMDRISLSEQWQVVGALRYGQYTIDQLSTARYSTSATTPSLSLIYKLTPKTSFYASYVEGLESGGTAPTTATNAGQSLPAAVSRQKELGVRTQLLDGLQASTSAFEISQPSAGSDSSNLYSLNGKQRIRGLEMSLQGDLTRNLSLVASLMLLDAQITQSTTAGLIGKTPENTPQRTGNLFVNYRVPGIEGFSVSAGALAMGARPVNDQNQAFIGGYTTYNAGLRYQTRVFGTKTTFQANIENLSDKRYWSAAGSGQLAVGMPRTITLSSNFEF
ncbi:TonB-dependent siderophore receptor [Herbaspirillum lusitanum]|uniref:TonB-dependent siderophore receptor n=1 Tax=Herbaspirillum lusitanum TaxID=213312 RepID=A0ABW9AD31_9BURK